VAAICAALLPLSLFAMAASRRQGSPDHTPQWDFFANIVDKRVDNLHRGGCCAPAVQSKPSTS
jgi:hypothetical protein